MNRRFLRSLLLGVLLLVLVLPGLAFAQDDYNMHGNFVLATGYNLDPTGCIATEVYVFAWDGVDHRDAGQETLPHAYVSIRRYNGCNPPYIMYGHGEVALANGQLKMQGNLSTATLDVTVPIWDQVTGQTINVEVHMLWTATNTRARTRYHQHYQYGDLRVHSHYDHVTRSAEASGSVLVGGQNMLFGGTLGAEIGRTRHAEVVVGE